MCICKMDLKYSKENVEAAIAEILPVLVLEAPEIESIKSRLVRDIVNSEYGAEGTQSDLHNRTLFIHYKRVRIWESLSLPCHYFVSVGNYEWHPGTTAGNIFMKLFNKKASTIQISEMCMFCAHLKLLQLFQNDKKFHFFMNNCQRITGYFSELILLYLYHAFLIVFLLTTNMLFFVLAMFLLVVVFVYDLFLTHRDIKMETCPHIKTNVNF